jgi:5-methylcytosine-specific restriction enzyme A
MAPPLSTLEPPGGSVRTGKQSGSRDPRYNCWRWRKASKAFLAKHPVCECGDACGRPSAVTDHIIPVKDGGEFWDRANWQALSDPCHRRKSQREQAARGELGQGRIKGCDLRGMPLDPAHPWNREKTPKANRSFEATAQSPTLTSRSVSSRFRGERDA